MTEPTSLKQMIQGLAAAETEVLQGVIKSESPLKIQIVNNDKLTIGESVTYVPKHLTDYKTTCTIIKDKGTINAPAESGDKLKDFQLENASIIIHNALKNGEKVHVLSFNHGKQYHVLGRVI